MRAQTGFQLRFSAFSRGLSLAAMLLVTSCGNEPATLSESGRPVTGPSFALGIDPVSGATIETNQDDYFPGELVHVVGHGWAANETVHLAMTEEPDTHDDVAQDVVADSAGDFSIHFYDVQEYDLGVTFTLTATGQTSGSRATAVFTDGNVRFITSPASLAASATYDRFSGSGSCSGSPSSTGNTMTYNVAVGLNAGQSIKFTVPTVAGYSYTGYTNSGLTITPPSSASATVLCVAGFSGGSQLTFTLSYVAAPTNTAPTVSAGNDATIDEGGTFSQSGSFTDPDANSWTATVNYGDGSGVQALTLVGKAFSLSHLYADNGTYTVTVSVNDGTAAGTDDLSVTVNNVAPVVSAGADAGVSQGGTLTQSGSFTDPGADTWTATVDYGDGSGVHPLTLNPNKTFNLSHLYANAGTFTVTVTVTDDESATGSDQITVTINNVPPTADAGGPYTGNEGSAVAIVGTAGDVDGTIASRTWSLSPNTGCTILDPTALSTSVTCTDNGSWTLTLTVVDDDGASASDIATLTIHNVAPSVAAGAASATLNEGDTFTRAGSFTDPGADTWTATVNYGDGSGVQALSLSGKTFSLSHLYADDGSHTVTVTITDDDTGVGSDQVAITVNNVAPAANAGAATATQNEGDTFTSAGSFTDPGADTWTATVNYGDGSGVQALSLSGKTFNLSHLYTDNGNFTVTVTVTDDDTGAGSGQVVITVNNVTPYITTVTIPVSPIAVGNPVTVGWNFTDPGADTWTGQISWDTGLPFGAGFPCSASKSCSTTSNLASGVYTVTVKVTDDDGAADDSTMTAYIVVYDPSGSFVTGGGWINSPEGAYAADLSLTGRATFGFVSKYTKGAQTPSGNTEFQFHEGGLNFKSTSYQWLVVSGARAQYKGVGQINGGGNYGFLLTAIDGQVAGGGGADRFRIKIWDLNNGGAIVYDNALGAAEDSDASTPLAGGSIVIHK
jgi:hypothetical protein